MIPLSTSLCEMGTKQKMPVLVINSERSVMVRFETGIDRLAVQLEDKAE